MSNYIENWVLPANPKYFDVISHFNDNNTIYWKQTRKPNINDNVYIYVAAPARQIKYKCIVTDNDLSKNDIDKIAPYAIINDTSTKYFKMKLVYEFDDNSFPLEILKENGLGQVQMIARSDRRFKEFLIKNEKNKITREVK